MANLYSGQFTTNQYSVITTSNLGIDGGNITIAFWMKLTSNPGSGVDMQILDQMSATAKVHYHVHYTENAGNFDLKFTRGKNWINGTTITKASANLGTTNWHHVAGTYDGTNLKLYLDGTLVAGPTAASGNGGTSGNNHFVIGTVDSGEGNSFAPGPAGRFYEGYLDDVMVFNADIGATRVSNLQSIPCNPDTTNLVARYELENNWNDTSGNGYNLTATNSPTFSSSTVAYTCATTPLIGLAMMGIGKR